MSLSVCCYVKTHCILLVYIMEVGVGRYVRTMIISAEHMHIVYVFLYIYLLADMTRTTNRTVRKSDNGMSNPGHKFNLHFPCIFRSAPPWNCLVIENFSFSSQSRMCLHRLCWKEIPSSSRQQVVYILFIFKQDVTNYTIAAISLRVV